MKPRFPFLIMSIFALLLVGTLVAASQVNSQEPSATQPGESVTDAQFRSPDAPTSLLFNYQGQLLNASGNPITNPATPMVFRLYTVVSGGTPCWSENRTVDVRNGVFSVLLGQTAAIDANCLRGDAYLELVVSGETLSPRERLTSVVHALEASTMTSGAVTQGSLNVSGNVLAAGSSTVPTVSGTTKWVLTGTKPESVMYGHNLTGAFGTTTQWDSDYLFTGLWDRGSNRKDAVIAWGDDPNDKLLFLQGIASESSPRQVMSWDTDEGLKVVGGLEVGLQDNGGGRLLIGNDPNDNKVYIEAFSSDMSGSASELSLTGKWASPVPQLSLVATNTSIRGNTEILGYARVGGNLSVEGWDLQFGGPAGGAAALRQDGSRTLHLMPYAGPGHSWDQVCIGCGTGHGNLVVNGDLDLVGSCRTASGASPNTDGLVTSDDCSVGSITSGAYVEANLMTVEERAAQTESAFGEGDVLCWGEDRLVLCDAQDDPLVMAVASGDGKPVVLGAERIKVLGPVRRGDYLVASGVPGYAMATRTPSFGIVIAQALENFDGEQGLIKAMIRKM